MGVCCHGWNRTSVEIWVVDSIPRTYYIGRLLVACQPPKNNNNNYSTYLLFPSSSLFNYSFLQSFNYSIIMSSNQFTVSSKRGQKCHVDTSDTWPKVRRYLKCFKYLLINPRHVCDLSTLRKNC